MKSFNAFLILQFITGIFIINVYSQCLPTKYRRINGQCNNVANPFWGVPIDFPFQRLIDRQYQDGIETFIESVNGGPLPNPRKISKDIFDDYEISNLKNLRYTTAMMHFGEFVAHDMSLTSNAFRPCCTGLVGTFTGSSKCFAITIPFGDPVYDANLKCIDFIRTSTETHLGPPKVVNKLNRATSFLDLSQIYGTYTAQANNLRTLSNGKLKTDLRNGYTWLPQASQPNNYCYAYPSTNNICYDSGNRQVNQNPGLAIIHTLYVREHNRIATALKSRHQSWNDEKVYQEARRINIAQYQYVVYYEWLPAFLGKSNVQSAQIIPQPTGSSYVNDYNANLKPSIYNEHMAVAIRVFHSQIPGALLLMPNIQMTPLVDHYRHSTYTEANFDKLLRGMVRQLLESPPVLGSAVQDHLMKNKYDKFGADLKAIDIQRGRDHGVVKYNDYRDYCDLGRATSWSDYLDVMSAVSLAKLMNIYSSYDDVELSVAAMLEDPVDSTTFVGPTLMCIFKKQFRRTRFSDRFWFETGDSVIRFTGPQLNEIRKSTFAKLICNNANSIASSQRKAFFSISSSNQNVLCSSIPGVNLSLW